MSVGSVPLEGDEILEHIARAITGLFYMLPFYALFLLGTNIWMRWVGLLGMKVLGLFVLAYMFFPLICSILFCGGVSVQIIMLPHHLVVMTVKGVHQLLGRKEEEEED